MNKEILNNLYEFWTYIGKKTGQFAGNDHYKSVSVVGSDWPNRVFSISPGEDVLSEIVKLVQRKLLPNNIAMPKPNSLENQAHAKLFLRQRNMALNLKATDINFKNDNNIRSVRTKADAFQFAKTASESFGYKVDGNIIYLVSEDPSLVRLFNYLQNDEYLGCEIVFFDSNNNAGLHMIGTLPNGRGQGIGTRMTEKLLWAARSNKSENCVLHASVMGENIYKKLGFNSFGELETYRILDK